MNKVLKISIKAKSALLNLNFKCFDKVCLAGIFLLFAISNVTGQSPEKKLNVTDGLLNKQRISADTTVLDSAVVALDSVSTELPDSTLNTQKPKGDIQTTINYSARDSINFSLDTKIVKLYGDSKIKYGSIELEADHIIIDYNKNTLSASGKLDSTGTRIGYPIFKNGAEVYETRDIVYNFKTGRARITEVVTQQGDGFLHGETVYKNEKNELFSIDNTYTTCNLRYPHFRIRAKRTKAIPDDKIVSGPFNLEINDVPTPLGFFFGMFPAQKESSSGIIVPTYGEEERRGFFLRNGGYFFDVSEYVKIAVRGDLYSKGGHGLNVTTNYRKRYSYNGNFNFTYTKLRTSDDIEILDSRNDYRLTWSHSPQSKGRSRFSASVNAATSSYSTNNFLGINNDPNNPNFDSFTRKLSSNVNYSTTFGSLFSLGLSARHNQDVSTNEVDLLLPSLTFNMSNIYPFQKKGGGGKGVLDKLSLRYTLAGTNEITNNLGRIGDSETDSIGAFNFETFGTYFKNANRGFRHTIPVATSFRLLKHFTASPSINYEERWYFDKLEYGLDPDDPTRAIVIDTLDGFNRVYEYNYGIGVNTRLYGTYFFKKGSIQAIRHVANPSISFSYRPDFSDEKFGYYQRLTTEEGDEIIANRYQGYIFGSPGAGESGSVGFSLTNTLEMKVKTKKDTTDQARKVPILNNFGFSGSYNVVADSFKLSSISLRANTALFQKKLTINFTGQLDPYVYIDNGTSRGRRVDQYTWNTGNGIGQLSRATIALSTNLNPKGQKKDSQNANKIANSDLSQVEKDFLLNNPDAYIDFEIPWSLRVNYNFNYTKTGLENSEITQTLRFSGDLSLTEKWKVNFNSGYDFQNNEFTTTTIGINRDLHCWVMNFNWTPFGRFTSYSFTIRVKSSLLQDLKIDRNRSFFDQF
ncbi:MAG: putative LPS assembly protein LptD [Bacteroidota bacterium]